MRKLVLAMPLTAAIAAVAAKALAKPSWGEAFLLGALLCPTDPVLSSSRSRTRARPAARTPLAQPRVGDERRARAARGARPDRRGRRDGRSLRRCALRAPGGGRRPAHRAARGVRGGASSRTAAASPSGQAPTRRRSTPSASRARPTAWPLPAHVEVVKLGIFVVFGALLTLPALLSDGLA